MKVEKIDEESSRISLSTLDGLSAACAQPPDVIFADCGYVLKDTLQELRRIAQQGKELSEHDLAGKALTT